MSDKVCEYRVVLSKSEEDGSEWYSIQEIYFDDEDKPYAQTVDLQIEGNNIEELSSQLQEMMWSLGQPVVDELYPRNEIEISESKEKEIG